MKCPACGHEVYLGSTITAGCDQCLHIVVAQRREAIRKGWKPTKLAPWALKRIRELRESA